MILSKHKMNKAVAQKLQSSRIVCFCVPSCHSPVEALALRYWHDGGEGGGLLSPAHTSHTYNIVYPPYPTHSPPCLSEGTASQRSHQNMGTGKGFKHIYIYIYIFKFVVSFLKIHQLGGSDTLWGVEVAKKHISQLMVADFLHVLRFNPDLDHQRRGWHTTDIKCYETFRAIWHRIYETFTTWNLWDTCRNIYALKPPFFNFFPGILLPPLASTGGWRQSQITALRFSHLTMIVEGSLEVKLPTKWTDGKAEVGKKMQVRKGRKVAKHCVFPMICGSGGSKSRLAKAAGRSQLARWEMKICTPLWREAHFEVKMYKTHHCRTTFGSWDVEKVRAVVARSTFPSQNVQNTPGSDHFWKLRCRKSARRCGAKHISKSKCTKHPRRCGAKHISKSKVSKTDGLGALLEVEMLNKCTPLWHEAHFEVKSVKNWRSRATFGRSDVVSHGRRKGLCTLPKGSKTCRFCSSFNYNHYTPLHSTPPHSTPLHYTTVHSTTTTTTLITRHLHLPLRLRLPLRLHLHYTIYSYSYNYNYNYATLHYTTLHYTTLHCTTLH